MSNDLFNPLWEKKTHKRIYYKATASNGAVALRGSWQDKYTHACIRIKFDYFYENQLTWASFHARQDLAQRACKSANKNSDEPKFECVKLEQISAKEFNRLRRLDNKNYKKYWQQMNNKILDKLENELETTGGN